MSIDNDSVNRCPSRQTMDGGKGEEGREEEDGKAGGGVWERGGEEGEREREREREQECTKTLLVRRSNSCLAASLDCTLHFIWSHIFYSILTGID